MQPVYRTRAHGDKWPEIGWRRRSIFGAVGLRGPLVDSTRAETALMERYASGARRIVEIGVFEGAVAAAMRRTMHEDGELVLIDPYPRGRLAGINMANLVARRALGKVRGGEIRWIRKRSDQAAIDWSQSIDFLRIDGVHNLEGVQADWDAWSGWVRQGGHVALRQDVVPAAVEARDRMAKADEILPWILASDAGWEPVERLESVAVLRRL